MKHLARMFRGWPIVMAMLMSVNVSTKLSASDSGVSLGPALILVQDVKPGEVIDLGTHANVEHGMTNHGLQPETVEIVAAIPDGYGFKQFECGYEPPGDATWFKLRRDKETAPKLLMKLASKERGLASLVIAIPDKPENWNRHFVVYIEGGQPSNAPVGTALRMRARILLETASRAAEKEQAVPGGVIAAGPSLVSMKRGDDRSWKGSTCITNNDNKPASLVLLRLGQVYSGEDAEKGHRFFQALQHAVLEASWAQGDVMAFDLKAGETREVSFTAPADCGAEPGSWKDEVFFIGRLHVGEEDPPKDGAKTAGRGPEVRKVDDRVFDRMELLRLRYVQPKDDAPGDKEKRP